MKDFQVTLKNHLKALEIRKSVLEEGDEQITLSEKRMLLKCGKFWKAIQNQF